MSFVIRSARPEDMTAVVELVRGLATYEKLSPPDDAAAQRLANDAFGPEPRYELLVAEMGGDVVGYAAFFFTYSTFLARPSLYLDDLFVRPDARGRGIGRAFLVRLAGIALERGCCRLDWSVLDWNVDAQRFYRSLGAEVMPGWWTCRLEGERLAAAARLA